RWARRAENRVRAPAKAGAYNEGSRRGRLQPARSAPVERHPFFSMRLMISCGEPSGDLYAASLARELQAREPGTEIVGFGGERLQAAGARLVGDFRGISVTGLTEAVRVLPRSYAMLRRLVADAKAQRPDVFVAIDFPDFNF